MNSIKVCNNAYTLSGKGFPCQNDPNDFSCAWCTKTGFQWGFLNFWYLINEYKFLDVSQTIKTAQTAKTRQAGAGLKRIRSIARASRETADTFQVPVLQRGKSTLNCQNMLHWSMRGYNYSMRSFRCKFQGKVACKKTCLNKQLNFYECQCADD